MYIDSFQIVKESKKSSICKLSSKQSFIHKDTVLGVGVDFINELDNGLFCLNPLAHNEVINAFSVLGKLW